MLRKNTAQNFNKFNDFWFTIHSFSHQHVRRELWLLHKRFALCISGIVKRCKLHPLDTNHTVSPFFIFCISSLMLFNGEGNRCKMCLDLVTPPWQLRRVSTCAAVGMQMCACGQGRSCIKRYACGFFEANILLVPTATERNSILSRMIWPLPSGHPVIPIAAT